MRLAGWSYCERLRVGPAHARPLALEIAGPRKPVAWEGHGLHLTNHDEVKKVVDRICTCDDKGVMFPTCRVLRPGCHNGWGIA
jgi:hypothetical protein